jgi:DNA-binding CsgD family transcriptional regulator
MILSTKEKEKRVLEYVEQEKSYREIQDQLHISSRDISFIVKKAKEKKDKEEEKKIQTSITSKAYKLYTKGKSPLQVATILGIEAREARKLYTDYLDLKGCHHLVEVLQQFDRQTIRDFSKPYMTNDNRIDEKKLIEAIKMHRNLPKIKEEYNSTSSQLKDLQAQRDRYYSYTNFLINKNLELQDEVSLASNKIKEHVTELLKQKDPYIRASIMTILKIIKEDPEKETLINNNNLYSSDQKISEMVAKFHDTISEIIVNSIINSNNTKNNYDIYKNQGRI